jgi:hypothetical protein
MVAAVVADLLGARGACASTAASSARTSRVIDAVLDAYYGGRGDAFWARPATWNAAATQKPPGDAPPWLARADLDMA